MSNGGMEVFFFIGTKTGSCEPESAQPAHMCDVVYMAVSIEDPL